MGESGLEEGEVGRPWGTIWNLRAAHWVSVFELDLNVVGIGVEMSVMVWMSVGLVSGAGN